MSTVDGPDDPRSIGRLFAAATTELSALVHDEIALAKAELREDVRRGAAGGGAFGGAGVLVLFALPVLSFAAAYGIHNAGLGLWLSFLLVGVAYLLLAGVLVVYGKAALRKIKKPELTIASAKESAAVLQHAKPHPRGALEPGTADGTGGAPGGAVEAGRRTSLTKM
jgi:hypothetical protein